MEQESQISGGLFTGFEGYRSPTEDARAEAIQHWLIVLDTNVLLNLYNFQGSSLQDFTEVFKALGDRLFIPHQAMDEFWRNRRTVLTENKGRHREQDTVQKAFDDINVAFRKWHQRVVDRTNPPPPDAIRELNEARKALLQYMEEKNQEAGGTTPDTPTHEDRVLLVLDRILQGKVGPAPDTATLQGWTAEGQQRIAAKRPPGYMDGEKNPERAIGDFLVWRQTMEESQRRALPVLFVTQDQKEDWWADRGTASMRARPELVSELLAFSGQRLLMIGAHELVRLGVHLGVHVSQATVDEAAITSEDQVDGWTAELVDGYLYWLSYWPGHLDVLREAVNSGGTIDRETMANILGKDPDAQMRGQGRPYSTAIRRLVEEGYQAVDPPFVADYPPGSGIMHRFVMPPSLVPFFKVGFAIYDAGDPESL